MKLLLWITFAVLTGLWTALCALVQVILRSAADWLQRPDAMSTPGGVATPATLDLITQWMKAWVRPWLDPALSDALETAARTLLELLVQFMPMAGTAMHWLLPLLWGIWVLGVVFMLALSAAAHLGLGGRWPGVARRLSRALS